jgi:hypothetical protein
VLRKEGREEPGWTAMPRCDRRSFRETALDAIIGRGLTIVLQRTQMALTNPRPELKTPVSADPDPVPRPGMDGTFPVGVPKQSSRQYFTNVFVLLG